jgi:ATP synthase F1 complex assembly factor 1
VEDPSSESPLTAKAETEEAQKAAEIHYLEHGFPSPTTSTTIFTSLASYKLHGPYATPHTTLIHHTDLADSHGIVLMNGSVMEGLGVSPAEAQWLVVVLQRFYAGVGGEAEWGKRKRLLERFSNGDGTFRVEDVLEEAEKAV